MCCFDVHLVRLELGGYVALDELSGGGALDDVVFDFHCDDFLFTCNK